MTYLKIEDYFYRSGRSGFTQQFQNIVVNGIGGHVSLDCGAAKWFPGDDKGVVDRCRLIKMWVAVWPSKEIESSL
jgi:hypothetical protein